MSSFSLAGRLLSALILIAAGGVASRAEATDDDSLQKEGNEFKDYKIVKPVAEDTCEIPEGDSAKLLRFADPMNIMSLARANQLDQRGYLMFRGIVMKKVADKVLANADSTAQQKDKARTYRLQALSTLLMFDREKGTAEFEKYAAEVRKNHPGSEAAHYASAFEFQYKHLNVPNLSKDVGDKLIALAKAEPKNPVVAQLVGQLPALLENRFGDEAVASYLNSVLREMPDHRDSKTFKGMLRRMPGQTMTLSGPTLAGTNFDLSQYKGKVVLVDFWATWCGPCIKEIPHVKAAYEKFHEKGFEIVGISLDNSREKLEDYVKKENMPWQQIIFSDAKDMGWNNPIAGEYGIRGIPAMFLIGRDGKVVKAKLRGEGALEEAVEKELAKPAPTLN